MARHHLELSVCLPSGMKVYRVGPDRILHIGKGELVAREDICIDHPSVAEQHAYISRDESEYTLRDLGSPAGTRLGGVTLPPGVDIELPPECVVDVGEVRIVARQRGRSAVNRYLEFGEFDFVRTKLAQERRDRFRLPFALLTLDAPPEVRQANPALDEPLELRPLEPPQPYRIGSSRICRIHLDSRDVASEHIALDVGLDGVWVTQLSKHFASRLGTRVLEVGQKVLWDWKDVLKIGPVLFSLYDPIAFAQSELERYEAAHGRRPSLRTQRSVALEMSRTEALVLLDCVKRLPATNDDNAEGRLLRRLASLLEGAFPEHVHNAYDRWLDLARARVGNFNVPLELKVSVHDDNEEADNGSGQ